MFTGIIEAIGRVEAIQTNGTNLSFTISSEISAALKVDQSVSHDGVCLTVEKVEGNTHQVTAIAETLRKTNLQHWKAGRVVNLERCLQLGDRLDGHLVQGHVDATGVCTGIVEQNGSWLMRFSYPQEFQALLIERGSVCINGISLTCFDLEDCLFSVAIIPYTYQHTSMQKQNVGDNVNLEFDVIAKYLHRWKSLSSK